MGSSLHALDAPSPVPLLRPVAGQLRPLRLPSIPRIYLLRRPPRLVAALLPRARLRETLALTAWVAGATPAPPLPDARRGRPRPLHRLPRPLPPAPSTVIGPPGRRASSSASRAPSIPLLQAPLPSARTESTTAAPPSRSSTTSTTTSPPTRWPVNLWIQRNFRGYGI